jgi:hypothetical protein
MGIHVPSYDQWFRIYGLPKMTNAAGILSWTYLEEADHFELFLPIFKMKTQGTLNTIL